MLAIRALLLVGTAALVMAQETPRVRNRGERTREFLGLGPAPDPAAAARGEKLYAASCSFCHGDKATGG